MDDRQASGNVRSRERCHAGETLATPPISG